MLTEVDVIHVSQRYGISILVVIKGDTDLIKQQLYVEVWCVLIKLVVHNNLMDGHILNAPSSCWQLTLPSPDTGLRMN